MIKYVVNDLVEALRYLPIGLGVGLFAFVLLKRVNIGRVKREEKPISLLPAVLLFMYGAVLVSITFFSRENGSRSEIIDMEIFSTWGINARNNAYVIENILLFLPFGILCPWVFSRLRKWYCTTLVGLSVSLCVELLQLITGRGFFQVDDILTNTFGALVGYVVYKAARRRGRDSRA